MWWKCVRTGIPRAVTGPSHASEQGTDPSLRGLAPPQGFTGVLKGSYPEGLTGMYAKKYAWAGIEFPILRPWISRFVGAPLNSNVLSPKGGV